jgi:hypothetical protein
MWRIALACGCVFVLGFGSRSQAVDRNPTSDLVFLTRAGCVNERAMRARFDEALMALGWPTTYASIDADKLPETDPRRGYGTPTILYQNADVFGMPEPSSTKNPPT